jgi:predicted ATPase with chaperone activity
MNLLKLSQTELAGMLQAILDEVRRRAKIATTGLDAAAIIHGNEMAKRAVQVAAAGRHSILFVGPANSGKTMLRAVCLELGLDATFEARPCSCGNYGDPRADCHCTGRQIERTFAKFPVVDITVQVFRPSDRERGIQGTSLAHMDDHIAQAKHFKSVDLDEHSANLLKAATAELGLDPAALERIIRVARTIANLDQSKRIGPSHTCEAINYRMLRR